MKEKWHTYDEWKALDYQVQKGEKGSRHVQGKVLFHKRQVKPIEHFIVSANWDLSGYDDWGYNDIFGD